jgi:hypothetical protein
VSVEDAQKAKAQREAAYAKEEAIEGARSAAVEEDEEKTEKRSFLDKVKDIF